VLFNAIDRHLGRAAEHGEHRPVLEEVDSVVAPFAGSDLATVQTENAVELAPVEGHPAYGGGGRSTPGLAPVELARLDFAVAHAAPPTRDKWITIMIAPDTDMGKGKWDQRRSRLSRPRRLIPAASRIR